MNVSITANPFPISGFKVGSSMVYQITATDNQGTHLTQFNQTFTIIFNYQDSDWAGQKVR